MAFPTGTFDSWNGKRVAWVVLELVLAALIGLALVRCIGSLLFAVFLYYATRPLYRRLDRRIDHPNVTAAATILLVVLPLLAVVAYAVVALRELDQFLAASDLEALRSTLQPYLRVVRRGNVDRLREAIASGSGGSAASVLQQGLPGVVGRLRSIAAAVFAVLARFFLMLTFLFASCGTTGRFGGGSTRASTATRTSSRTPRPSTATSRRSFSATWR